MINLKSISGGITSVPGITASGISCGIKKEGKKDLALIYSNPPAVAAGVFTTNIVVSPSVTVCRENMKKTEVTRAIVVNSGNANACTGAKGYKNAREITRLVAESSEISPESVLMASTGVIGVPLPMEPIENGLETLVKGLSDMGGCDAAEAIMTTDLVPKEYAVEYEYGGKKITVGGMAKGSGMIQPNMATMLAFIASDISISKEILQKVLREVTDLTFNRITVDGETSTNDTLLCIANGSVGNIKINTEGEELSAFKEALTQVCLNLAQAVVRDGEGATKFIEICVSGMETDVEAEQIARNIANSLLAKTAFFGEDPNWGRILSAAGSSGVTFDPKTAELHFGNVLVMKNGGSVEGVDQAALKEVMKKKDIRVLLNIGQGNGNASLFTTDLSYDYVKINGEYTT